MNTDTTTDVVTGEDTVRCEVCLTPLSAVSQGDGRRCSDHHDQLALVPLLAVCAPRRSPEQDGERR